MGKGGADSGRSLTLAQLPDILGEAIPEMPANAIEKHRLVTALRNRFGSDFRNIPGVRGLISEFEENIVYENRLTALKELRSPAKKKKES